MFKKSNLGIGGIAVVGVLFVAIMLLANLLLRGAKLDLTADKHRSRPHGAGEPVPVLLGEVRHS